MTTDMIRWALGWDQSDATEDKRNETPTDIAAEVARVVEEKYAAVPESLRGGTPSPVWKGASIILRAKSDDIGGLLAHDHGVRRAVEDVLDSLIASAIAGGRPFSKPKVYLRREVYLLGIVAYVTVDEPKT